MYHVQDIAIYMVNYCNEKGLEITNLKLQKLLYFVQGGFYIIYDEPCFKEDIQCWQYGPVVPEVYSLFRKYGSVSIPEIYTVDEYDLDTQTFIEKEWKINFKNEEHKACIDVILDHLARLSAFQLVDITHKQEPWYSNYEPYHHNIISKNELRSFFRRDLDEE